MRRVHFRAAVKAISHCIAPSTTAAFAGSHVQAFSRRLAPELCKSRPSDSREGTGKAGYRPIPMVRVQQKHAVEPQVQPNPAFPAQWFDGLYVISSGTGLIAPVCDDARAPRRPQHREARTTRFHRAHELFVGTIIVLQLDTPHRSPPPRAVTIAIRPSSTRRDVARQP